MNKTSFHILITTGLFIILIILISVIGFVRIANYDAPTDAGNEPQMPLTRGVPAPAMSGPMDTTDNESGPTAHVEQNILVFLLVVILLSILFSVIMTRLAQKPLKEVLEKQKQFVADASHELKTPLSLMSTEIQLFQERHQATAPTAESTYTFTQHILFDVHRLTAITNDMLQLVKLDGGAKKTTGETIPLTKTLSYLEGLKEKIMLRYPTHQVQFASEIKGDMTLYASPSDLMQVVEILLENACLHTPDYTEIEMIQTLEKNQYQLRISDDGPGIAPEHVKQLFVRFFQVDSSSEQPGTGLGLPIAKELIEHWGGSLLVDSEVSVGTTMTIVLPAKKLS